MRKWRCPPTTHVSLLIKKDNKEIEQIISTLSFMPVQTGAIQRTRDARDIEDGTEHKLFKFFDVVVNHGFKSIVS
jgi:hypothetical protein